MILCKAEAEETRADLDFDHPKSAPHRLERIADAVSSVVDAQRIAELERRALDTSAYAS